MGTTSPMLSGTFANSNPHALNIPYLIPLCKLTPEMVLISENEKYSDKETMRIALCTVVVRLDYISKKGDDKIRYVKKKRVMAR